MQISAAGLKRFVYNHNVGPGKTQDHDISIEPSGDVTIRWKKYNVRMNGDYVFESKLSREEIARLFVESFGYGRVLQALEQASDPSPTNASPAT